MFICGWGGEAAANIPTWGCCIIIPVPGAIGLLTAAPAGIMPPAAIWYMFACCNHKTFKGSSNSHSSNT